MKQCWAEGALRAYHDGELPPAEMERVAAHLAECPNCEALADEIAGRAARVAKLMSALPDPQQLMWTPRRASAPVFAWPRWVAGAAVAAGLAYTIWVAPWRAGPVAAPSLAVSVASVAPQVIPEIAPEIAPAAVRRPGVKARAAATRPAPKHPPQDVFFALDDEPIETGVVMRVALGEAEIPAEVVFGKDGRPRAIRLVSNLSNR